MNPGSDEAIEKGCTCPVMDNVSDWRYRLQLLYLNHNTGVGDGSREGR
jgi:hypothetical protein